LRKAEIDGLEWGHINFNRAAILVEPTEFRGLKSEESAAEVQIDPALAEELRQFMPKAGEPRFVIESTRPARPGIDRQYYRAQPVFQRLYTWLRGQGIKNRCPLHTLRKEFGSLINEKYGLFAPMTALRHSSIAITSTFYVDNKRRIALPMADYLKASDAQEKASSEWWQTRPAGPACRNWNLPSARRHLSKIQRGLQAEFYVRY
jgi:integrase